MWSRVLDQHPCVCVLMNILEIENGPHVCGQSRLDNCPVRSQLWRWRDENVVHPDADPLGSNRNTFV